MPRQASLSPRGSITNRLDNVNATSPSLPRYLRDPNGLLKYVIQVDLRGVPRENLKVTTQKNSLHICAKYDVNTHTGDKTTHEVHRELHMPGNVDSNTVRCFLAETGIMTIEADAFDSRFSRLNTPFVRTRSSRWPRSSINSQTSSTNQDPRRVTFVEPTFTQATTTGYPQTRAYVSPVRSQQPTSPIHTSSGRHSRPTRVMSPEPTYMLSSQTSPRQAPFNAPQDFNRKQIYFPHKSNPVTKHVSQSPRRFSLSVEVGAHITPEDLTITRQNGVLVIHAKRYVRGNQHHSTKRQERLVFEHRSEHTLPSDISLDRLTARLENGLIHIDAPYVTSVRYQSMSPMSKLPSTALPKLYGQTGRSQNTNRYYLGSS